MSAILPKRLISARAMLFFSVILLLKGYLAWFVIFEKGPSWRTLLKELPFVLIVFCLIEWFAKKRKLAYYMGANLLFTVIFFSVIMYYKYYGVIATYRSLDQVSQVPAVKEGVFSLMHPQYLLIFADIVVIGILLFRRKRMAVWMQAASYRVKPRLVAMLFALSVGLCLMNIMPYRASMNEIVKAEEMGILNYEAYTLFARNDEKPVDPGELTQDNVNKLKGIRLPDNPQLWKAAERKNVILIQMESLQNFLLGLTIDGAEVTPVLNQLAREHFYFPNFYHQAGQGSTSDAEFVVNTSLYIPPHGAAVDVYTDKRLPSLPRLLSDAGYQTATFHTNEVHFWNRDKLYRALGFDRYYDKSYFGEEDKVFFGASDEVLYAKTAEELERMNREGRPFYAQVISMTAHYPFTIPEYKTRLTLPEHLRGNIVGDYIRAQNYADYALGRFIEDLKARGVWDDSLIVIYGDHQGLTKFLLEAEDKTLLESLTGRTYDYPDMLNVPLIIAGEGVTFPARFEQVGGQVDILPTIANLLGVSLADYLHFGQDLLNQIGTNLLPQRYFMPSGSFLNMREAFLSGSGFADGTHYPLDGDGRPGQPQATEDEFNRSLELLRLSDGYVRQLPNLNE